MALYNMPNMSGGMDDTLVGISTMPGLHFISFFLFFVWGVVFIGGAMEQKRRTGSIDAPMWAAVSMLTVMMVSLILTLKSGLIQLETLVIVAVLTVLSGVWLFFDRNRMEV